MAFCVLNVKRVVLSSQYKSPHSAFNFKMQKGIVGSYLKSLHLFWIHMALTLFAYEGHIHASLVLE